MATGAASTGLEIAKLAVAALTPARRGRRRLPAQPAAVLRHLRRPVEGITPGQAITLKRELDETMYANQVLFSDHLFAAYQPFMRTLFAMYASTDADAPLRVPIADILGDRRNLP
jgi:hypothetical protein